MVRPERVTRLGGPDTGGDGPVVYWMNRDCRLHDNWAYIYARELGLQMKRPVIVAYNLAPGFLGGGYRQHVFKVGGLEEVAEVGATVETPFFLVKEKGMHSFLVDTKAAAVVVDFSPLREQRAWVDHVVLHATCPVYEVDAHNIVPCRVVSSKAEVGARTLRPKLHKLLPEYLEPFPRLTTYMHPYTGHVPHIRWADVRAQGPKPQNAPEVDGFVPGHTEGMKRARAFIQERLSTYATLRNDATAQGQSGLSPYLHYGHIAAARVVLEALKDTAHPERAIVRVMDARKNGSGRDGSPLASFLEELIVRRELSDNFCFYTPDYDSFSGFPHWAQKTLNEHRDDEREYVYSRKQFEEARTHDPLWNAAQRELLTTGKMHGYMRMYWGKKILEWSASPEEAQDTAIYLNDTYELDGRDPNGYAGIAWSIGGTHDRPWFTRPIFGAVRYMARSGCEKKFDVEAYIARFT